MIAFIHSGNFGLAVEQMENPLLRERPVALLHSATVPLLAELSPEACAAGLLPGMTWAEAQALCPGLARVVARPAHYYASRSQRLLQVLADICPELEPFAPGEAFLDLTRCQSYYRHDPRRIGWLLQEAIAAEGGPACGIGIAGDKTTAHWAARQAAPGGIEVIPPGAAAERLAPLTLPELCGAGPAVTDFLADHGVLRCGDMARIPIGLAARRFGNHGRRLWLMAQGLDPSPVRPRLAEVPGLPGLGRLLPPACADAGQLLAALGQVTDKLLRRLQREGTGCQELRISLRAPEGWRQEAVDYREMAEPANRLPALRRLLRRHWFGEVVRQVQVQALPPPPAAGQADFFSGRGGTDTGRPSRR